MEFINAIKEGDGSRIIHCWKYLLPIFQATKRNNYTCEAFTLLIDVNYLLSPRMAHQLKWSRTVNMHGLPGQNVSCDLYMEHMNQECKAALSGLGSNVTDRSIKRIGKCIGRLIPIMENFDSICQLPTTHGCHSTCSCKGDIDKVATQLTRTSYVFLQQRGRVYKHFSKFKSKVTRNILFPKFEKWMNQRLRKVRMYHKQ